MWRLAVTDGLRLHCNRLRYVVLAEYTCLSLRSVGWGQHCPCMYTGSMGRPHLHEEY